MSLSSKPVGIMAGPLSFAGQSLKERLGLLSFVSIGILIILLCLVFAPRWETNDDVAMSMVAHGYGVAAQGSPNLLDYSNVLWGHIVRGIPAWNGVLGYSWSTIITLFFAGWAMFYFLLRLGTGYWIGLCAVALVITRPTLFPQFTANAGLLTLAAVMGWRVYARFKDPGSLLAACLLAFVGFLLRNQAFFLILGVALPLCPWKDIRRQRILQIALAVLALAIAGAAILNQQAYRGHAWKDFRELSSSTAPFNNYSAGERLKKRPDILARYGYSKNDIDLLSASFFADPQIAAPETLNAMMTELGPLFTLKENIPLGFSAWIMLVNRALVPLFISGLFLLLLSPRRSVALAWVFCLTALFAIGITGHPPVLRVYFPLMSLLLLAPLALAYPQGPRKGLALCVLLIACVGNICLLAPSALGSKNVITQAGKIVPAFPDRPVVIWGPYFPFEVVFPVFQNDPVRRKGKIFRLSAIDHTPFSVAKSEEKAGRGVIKRFCSPEGIALRTSEGNMRLLGIYCRERLGGNFQALPEFDQQSAMFRQVRCDRARQKISQTST